MKKTFFLLVIVISISVPILAQTIPKNPNKKDKSGKKQGTWTILFDKKWKETAKPDSAEYYRIITYKDNSPTGPSKDYFKNGVLQWEGVIVQENPQILDGLTIEYNADKSVKAMDYYVAGKRDAKKSAEQYVNLVKKIRDTPDHNETYLATMINATGVQFGNMSDYTSALPYYLEAVNMREKIFGRINVDFAISLANLCQTYISLGEYEKAQTACSEALAIREKLTGKETLPYAYNLHNLGWLYEKMTQFDRSETYYLEAAAIRQKLLGKENGLYATTLNNLAQTYKNMGEWTKAETYNREAIRIREKLFGKASTPYAVSINDLGTIFADQGNYEKALPLLEEAKKIVGNKLGVDHPWYAQALNNLGVLYVSLDKPKLAEEYYLESVKITAKALGKTSDDYISTVNNLAFLYTKYGKYAKAEELYNDVWKTRQKILDPKHADYILTANHLAKLYGLMGQDEKAITLFKEGNTNWHPYRSLYTEYCAEFFFDRSQLDAADSLYAKSAGIRLNQIQNNFIVMTEQQREAFYQTYLSSFLNNYNSFSVKNYTRDESAAGDMYDMQLFTKALLLNNSAKWKQRIRQSGDVKLFSLYQEWEGMAKRLAKAESENQTKESIDQLRTKTEELEKNLTKRSELFSRSFDKKKYTWKDVVTALQPGEAAVEIIRFRKRGVEKILTDSSDVNLKKYVRHGLTDTIQYAALIVKPGIKNPKLILLSNGNELEEKYLKNYQNSIRSQVEDKKSYEQYWKPIHEDLKGVRKVYFSSDGVFHKINLNTLKDSKTGKFVLDDLEIVLVTNTKDILQPNSDPSENKYALLMGMPDYSLNPTVQAMNAEVNSQRLRTGTSGLERSLDNLAELVGTKIEVEKIAELFQSKNWQTDVFLKENALEENIKDAFKPSVLHIATHGYFKEETSEGSTSGQHENPLLQSGLVLAGAGTESKEVSSEDPLNIKVVEDGILTAYEAMNLNLDNTEIVVLSACETGLGEIKNGEGVYGLQRAFKVAGARTVVMSLWKVNDETTQELMVTFYKKWLSGIKKSEAFRQAQFELKKKHKEPYFWGAFVMIGEK